MKQPHFIFVLILFSFTTAAQKQTYFLLTHGQKTINTVCGEKILIQQDEVSIMPAEIFTYRNKLLTEIRATYRDGYKNFYVELIPAGKAVIVYEFETVYTKQKDGWDCTTSFYGCVTGADMLAAEKAFASLQAQYKKSTYKEVSRWGEVATSEMGCEELISYRDKDLVQMWNKYRISSEHLSDIKRFKSELEDDSRYTTSNLNMLTITLKTLANSLEDILGAASPKGQVVKLVSYVGQNSGKALEVIASIKKGEKTLNTLISNDAAKTIATETATQLGQMGKALSFIKNLSDNLYLYKDLGIVQQDVKKQLNDLDKAMISYQEKFKNPENSFKEINDYKNYIDNYLKENCNN